MTMARIWTKVAIRPLSAVASLSVLLIIYLVVRPAHALVPFLDGGKDIPSLYGSWFNEQISKQASTAIGKAISAGKTKLEVNFPPVPNVEEVRFGTPLNQKFGKQVVAKDLKVSTGYTPGSDLSRQLIAYSNIYWAKKIASAVGGGLLGGKSVAVLSAEPVVYKQIQSKGDLSVMAPLNAARSSELKGKNNAVILVNPGGEETWERIREACGATTCVVLNNAYSTTYDLGNKRGYEEAYYLKRISKGWVFRAYPGPWQAYLERPDGKCEILKSYQQKPPLNEVATLVREESFRRYAINNDRWTPGFGERL